MEYFSYYQQASEVVKAVILLLAACFILVIALFVVKLFTLLLIGRKIKRLKQNMLNKNYQDELLQDFLTQIKEDLASSTSVLERKLENHLNLFSLQLNYALGVFATLGNLAPFIGLFGTVWGILKSFESIKGASNTSLEYIAPHISESLFATALGLFVAIPSVFIYNFFSKLIARMSAELEYSLNLFIIEHTHED